MEKTERTFKEALELRRSYYNISSQPSVPEEDIENMVRFAIKHVPSAFNSQSTRLVLLMGEQHARLWSIVMETLRKIVPADNFGGTEAKINSFAAGYGSILYFEDNAVVESLQQQFPLYAQNFPTWAEHTSAMHQLALWTMLENAGLGASLQHYNPLIDNEIRATWQLPASWRLIAQMPFGTPTAPPAEKQFSSIDERLRIFK